MRLFDVPEATVTEGAACTWCGAEVGRGCEDWRGTGVMPVAAHAQRWRDYWNETHAAVERVSVYVDPKRARPVS